MSDDEPYEQEFEEEEEPQYFHSKPNSRPPVADPLSEEGEDQDYFESKPASRPSMPLVKEEAADPSHSDDYDEDFEDKSMDQSPPKHVQSKPAQADRDFFLTGVRGSSKGTARSQAQSSTVHTHIDSPEKAFKVLAGLKKENVDLRGQLKAINDRLNELIDQKISESNLHLEPRKTLEPEQREQSCSTQLKTALSKVSNLKKEKSLLYQRIQRVEDPAYVDNLKAEIEKKERTAKRLQKAVKGYKQVQQTRDKSIQKEIDRSELSLNTRLLQEIAMENEGLRAKIRDLETMEERNSAAADDLEKQQEKLENRYVKLMAVAKENGTFDEHTRENRRARKTKAAYEEEKQTLAVSEASLEASLKQLKRTENDLKSDLESLRFAQNAAIRQMSEKQAAISALLGDLQKLRPRLQGSGYEPLLERIAAGIKEKEGLAELPITPLRAKSPIEERRNSGKVEKKGRKSPFMGREGEGKQSLPSLEKAMKPPMFASPVVKEEKPALVPIPAELKAPEPAVVPKKPSLMSKPSLFSASKEPEPPSLPLPQPKASIDPFADLIPTKEVAYTPAPRATEEVKAPLTVTSPQIPKSDLPIESSGKSASATKEEIATLETFPSRRRGKKPPLDPGPAFDLTEAEKPAALDLQPRPRNRSHLLDEEPALVQVPPAKAVQAPVLPVVELPAAPVLSKPRDRSHLLEESKAEVGSKASSEQEEGKLGGGRDRSYLADMKPAPLPEMPAASLGLLDRKKDIKIATKPEKDERTAELAKKAEKGGFFGLDENSDSLDFADLNQAVKPVTSKALEKREDTPPVRKAEPRKQQVLDLEEEDLVL